ncbi:hypothetical protein BDN72DRAFT_834769 [Pluteus cervinus]|uniref:Uncharacterized protein n=1 Tax=Pluteus cervinus TaxID=181527 RepID=A0ACD3B6P6_9AGAR|nr:hypothetical protein BDN72DRAFT_834769 [Pluteus cervinus]
MSTAAHCCCLRLKTTVTIALWLGCVSPLLSILSQFLLRNRHEDRAAQGGGCAQPFRLLSRAGLPRLNRR